MIEESDKKSNKELNKENEELAGKMREVLNKYSDDLEKIDEMFKESNKKLNNELNKESNKELNKESNKKLNKEANKESNKELIETISPKDDENTTNWYDKNKFNKILTTIASINFNHKNILGKFKFNDINNLINNIKNNTISEADTKNKINKLNEIKKVETKDKRLSISQKTLLSLFNDLKINYNNNNNDNNNESDSKNEIDDEQYNQIEQINKDFKKIDETKSFKDQIDILKKLPWLNDFWYIEYYEDNKETNLRLFNLKLAHILNDVDDNLFKEIFGFTSVKLADKLINTMSKEENQMPVNDIEINRDKIFEKHEFNNFVIKQAHKSGDLIDTVRVILKFSEILSLDLT